MKETPAPRKPEPSHYTAAQLEYEKENPGKSFNDLPTRKRNALAKDQMYHSEYHDLCNAIMGVRK